MTALSECVPGNSKRGARAFRLGNLAPPPPKILHEIKVQHTHPLLPPHTSVSKLHLGEEFIPETHLHLPTPRLPVIAPYSSHGWVLSCPMPLERAAGGAHGLPQLPARGDSSEHLVHLGLAEDLQELEPWEEAGRAECMHVKGAAYPWRRGLWTCWVSPAPSRVWASLTTWGKFRCRRCPDGFVCGRRRRASQLSRRVIAVAATGGPQERGGTRAPHPC